MKDIYVLEQASKSKQLQDETDEPQMQDAATTESENYLKSREARLKLERAVVLQKQITEELEKQGEKIGKIKESSIGLYKNASASRDVSTKIKDESSILPSFGSLFKGVKRWWNTDRRMQREVQEIEGKHRGGIRDEEPVEVPFEPLRTEYIPGENKTERELTGILNSIRKMSSEGRTQLEMVKAQTEDISDIKKVSEYSKRIIDETEQSLRKK